MKKLNELLQDVPFLTQNADLNLLVSGIEFDSRLVQPGNAFFSLKNGIEGQKYSEDAIKNGASVVFSEDIYESIPTVQVNSTRRALGEFCAEFYGHPENHLKIIGIVGTNGKTTTACVLHATFQHMGIRSELIGTLGAFLDGKQIETGMTTPDTPMWFQLLAEAREKKLEYVIAEVSAHAIYYEKIYPCKLDYCIFTNLSEDHLDFFGTMEEYGTVKKSIFTSEHTTVAIVNTDDELGLEIIKDTDCTVFSYGLYNPSDVFAVDIDYGERTDFFLNAFDKVAWIHTPLAGEFNVYNVLACITLLRLVGIPIAQLTEALSALPEIPGRFNVLREGNTAIIDYAHTPDGLQKVLVTAKSLVREGGILMVVFGCGGNRDRAKRPIMGRIACKNADLAVITSDNPRWEIPMEIIREIEQGAFDCRNRISIPDRERAIRFALRIAHANDVVVICGKGAENYLEIQGEKIPFSDKEVCQRAMREKNGV